MKNFFFLVLIALFSSRSVLAAERIGFYTGTFDPIHNGHLTLLKSVATQFNLDRIYVIPNVSSGLKPNATPFDVRYEMVFRALEGEPKLKLVPKDELLAFTYSEGGAIEGFLKSLRVKTLAPVEVFQIMGADSFVRFLALPEAKKILKSNDPRQIIVGPRGTIELPVIKNPKVHFAGLKDNLDASSSAIRAEPLLSDAQLPVGVAKYIKEHRLYGRGAERGVHDLGSSTENLLEYEQTLNDKVEDIGVFSEGSLKQSELSPRYSPDRRPIFRIYNVEVPESELKIIITHGSLPDNLVVERNSRRFVRFFIHPESKSFFQAVLAKYEWKQDYLATPTSSYRSLIVWNPTNQDAPMAIKVSVNKQIGGSVRLLTRKQIERAAVTSFIVNSANHRVLADHGIHFIDESVGVYLKNFEFGYSSREYPQLESGHELVPMFSLYAKPVDGEPLIVKLIRQSGQNPKEFILEKIMRPMIDHMVYLAKSEGLVGEPHEQNVLVEMNAGQLTNKFHYRDLAGFVVSPEYRRKAGKSMDVIPNYIHADAFKSGRADLLDMADAYLFHSNFFALARAVEPYFPKVTLTSIQYSGRLELRKALKVHFGIESNSMKQANSELNKFLNSKMPQNDRKMREGPPISCTSLLFEAQ